MILNLRTLVTWINLLIFCYKNNQVYRKPTLQLKIMKKERRMMITIKMRKIKKKYKAVTKTEIKTNSHIMMKMKMDTVKTTNKTLVIF